MFTIARPVVVFPQPDSPTSPSVSPRSSVNDMPSTARTSPVRRSSRPPKTGNLTTRSFTSRMGGIALAGQAVQVAADEVAGRPLDERRLRAFARFEARRAAAGELAARREVEDVGHRAGDRRQPLGLLAVDARQRP